MNKYDLIFYVQYPYYYPHFLPISKEASKRGLKSLYILSLKQNTTLIEQIAKDENLEYILGDEKLYEIKADNIFFANAISINNLDAKTIFLCHGTGTKNCDYLNALKNFDLIIVEGEYRYKKLQTEFSKEEFSKVKQLGYSKLDDILNITKEAKEEIYTKYNLDKNKKTILYAPTFFPASIEKMSDNFPQDFNKYNIIVKPHYLSLSRNRYKAQQKKFNKWAKYSNCKIMSVQEYSLIPFLTIADIMISDESSAIFEFTALNKPVILNRFLKLLWSYYLNPKKLLKRLDSGIDIYRQIGDNANSYAQMIQMVNENLQNPQKYETLRKQYTKDICGVVDGKVSQRILDELY
jgi:CDP-glycerol glycerophosphotransferase (TagB/SpsB family)